MAVASHPLAPEHRIERLLVADRGEPALRVARAARDAGLESVVLMAEQDGDAAWPDLADYAVYVPDEASSSWPMAERVISAGLDSGCDAVHPGWNSICRSSMAAEMVIRSGMGWLGGPPQVLEKLADRSIQRAVAQELGIPVVPGSEPLFELDQVQSWLARAGTPALLKPVDTLGLRGRSVRIEDAAASGEPVSQALSTGPAIVERWVVGAREIEVVLLGGADGQVAVISDRETTVAAGLDRPLVEAPAPALSDERRRAMHRDAARIAQKLGWGGSAAARFLLTPDGRAYFLGIRPGLAPWHAATDVALGVDLVGAELHLASGADLVWQAEDLVPQRHAMALRVPVAEDGRYQEADLADDLAFNPAQAPGDAVPAGAVAGTLVVRAPTRQACIVRARAVLDDWPLEGLVPAAEPLSALLSDRDFWQRPLDRDRVSDLAGVRPGVDMSSLRL